MSVKGVFEILQAREMGIVDTVGEILQSGHANWLEHQKWRERISASQESEAERLERAREREEQEARRLGPGNWPANARCARGVIYFVEAVGSGRIKIGWTGGPIAKRVQALQTACPFELLVRHTVPGTQYQELDLHVRFAELRVMPNAEWFHERGPLAEFLASAPKATP